jgi:DNA helicase-2/ATP-dependent DNA helicase PcrA
MKERAENLIGSQAKYVWMGTFHSIFARILRAEADKLGYPPQFTIYDTDDQKSLIKKIVKEKNLDDKVYKPNAVISRISSAKSNLISHIDYNNNAELMQGDASARRPQTGDIYTHYQERLIRAGAMDFDDLLFNMNVLLRDFPEVLHKYQNRFEYILVDEYQDTNYAQYLIVKKLAANNENLCVVGDDAQSIYAFRGANIQNILNLQKDYPDLKVFKLEQNYRSTKNIVAAANSIIGNNKDQIEKEIWTSNDEGGRVELHSCSTDNEEGSFVARKIFDLHHNEKVEFPGIAILYRTNAQSRAIEEALRKMNTPYKIFGGLSFYKRKEIKDLTAYFRLAVNPRDEEALLRVINYPKRGIGQTTVQKIQNVAIHNNRPVWDVLQHIQSINILPAPTTKKLHEFATMIKNYHLRIGQEDAYELAMHIAKTSGILKELGDARDDEEGIMRFENIEELLSGIKEFSETQTGEEGEDEIHRLDTFMEEIALYTDADEKGKDDGNFVSLMTIHAAKGLEFPYVFVVGMEENLFPSLLSVNSRADLEEERRLFYVAVTRGEKQVYLSYSELRYKWGNQTFNEPSRFLDEIDRKFIEDFRSSSSSFMRKPAKESEGRMEFKKKEERTWTTKSPLHNKNLKSMDDAVSKPSNAGQSNSGQALQNGMSVYHQRFGKGKIVSFEGEGQNKKAIVHFHNVGEKKLLLKFAKLEILD